MKPAAPPNISASTSIVFFPARRESVTMRYTGFVHSRDCATFLPLIFITNALSQVAINKAALGADLSRNVWRS